MDALRHTISEWIQSGNENIPPILLKHIHESIRFHATKAIVCGILLIILVILSKMIWTALIRRTRENPKWRFKEIIAFVCGMATVTFSFLMLVIVVACTQGAVAPLTLYLASLM